MKSASTSTVVVPRQFGEYDRHIPIVVSGYNRPESLARILKSLRQARYLTAQIPLFISLDQGGPNGAREVAEAFEWPFGHKTVLARGSHFGMRDHAFACMDLFGDSDYLVFLEDDSFVGRDFYTYVTAAASCMDRLDRVFATSLYAFDFCEFDGLRFAPVPTEQDFFLIKSATTWGVLFSKQRWFEFRAWHEQHAGESAWATYVPEQVNAWPETSWKKHINHYLSATDLYFLYPYTSRLTHFADIGTHFGCASRNFYVPMAYDLNCPRRQLSCEWENLVRYDEFWEFIPPAQFCTDIGFEFECDLRRLKSTKQFRSQFVLTSRPVLTTRHSFAATMFPLEANLLENLSGGVLNLAPAIDIASAHQAHSPAEIRGYMKDIGARRELTLAVDTIFRKLRLRR